MKRVFLIVLDSFGIGEEPDADLFGDVGSNTIKSCAASEYFNIRANPKFRTHRQIRNPTSIPTPAQETGSSNGSGHFSPQHCPRTELPDSISFTSAIIRSLSAQAQIFSLL